ncbi:MAG TPA: ABC transporter ATP-binding protein, partial [Bacillota bacterium]|nr:ABC transporter ATP-binding protein [Bacillota bacterium]
MIDIRNADKYYNRQKSNELHVINEISMQLPDTGITAIFGKSGCGKTTLLNVIGGLDRLDSGCISVLGQDISKNTDDIRNKYIGYVFQNYYLSNNETVFENVANALYLCGITDSDEINSRVCASLESVGMIHFKNRFPDTLSGGQQQRVAIARAIVKDPHVILADEPTGNLDEANTLMIMNILKQISREHLVLLVTHEADLVDLYCDRVIEIIDGKVSSTRENENANGHTSRSKNDIYLGELEKHEGTVSGVNIEYYGDPSQAITLRVINNDGKLYLECTQPNVKIIDSGSEIKLREGVFEEKPERSDIPKVAISPLKHVPDAKYGRLFSFRSAAVSGYRENFSKKSKKGRKLLRFSMFLLAFVVVFLTANFAVSIKTLSDIRDDHGNNVFFIPLTAETNVSVLTDSIGKNGIDYIRVIGSSHRYSKDNISFRPGNFITASVSRISASGYVLDSSLLKGMTLAAGTTAFEKPLDAVITTALADELIENSTVSYIAEYSDLINLVSYSQYGSENYMRIVGVVESNEKNFYLNSLYSTYMILENVYYNSLSVAASSLDSSHSAEIGKGEIAIVGKTQYKVNDSVTIMGRKYTVVEIVKKYDNVSDYPLYVKENHGTSLLSSDEYFEKKLKTEPEADRERSDYEWFFKYATQY